MTRAFRLMRLPDGSPACLRDRLLWAGVAVWLLSYLPSLRGVDETDALFHWVAQYSDVPILAFVSLAAGLRARDAQGRRELVFWRLVLGCALAWIAARAHYVLVPYEQRGLGSYLWSDVCHLAGYLCLGMGLELRPDRDPPREARFGRVESLGAFVLAFLLLSYFTLTPAAFDPAAYASRGSSMLLFAVLDAYLLIRTGLLLRSGLQPGWTVPMAWLAAAFALRLAGDVTKGLLHMGIIPLAGPGTPADLLWLAPGLALFGAARSRAWPARAAGGPSSRYGVISA